MARHCPGCRHEMNQESFHGVDLDVCPTCSGLWFDPEELRKVITTDPLGIASLDDHVVQETKHGASTLPQSVTLECPNCSVHLSPYYYEYTSHVQMYACDKCGGCWVFEHELAKLQRWLDHEPQRTHEDNQKIALVQHPTQPGALQHPIAQNAALREFQMEHDAVMRRQEHLGALCNLMQTRVPIWWFGI